MRRNAGVLVVVLLALLLAGAPAQARGGLVKRSNADSIVLLHAFFPGYWWDHTNVTAAVQAAPNVDPTLFQAARDAIATWNAVLIDQFGGLITLTDVTDLGDPEHNADIVLHYVPHAGGVVFAGFAQCGDHKCNNILVSSEFAQEPSYTYDLVYWISLHELGHGLGLGHAEPLETTNDLMGYGWIFAGKAPVLSFCDIAGLQAVFAWALEGSAPYEPTTTSVEC